MKGLIIKQLSNDYTVKIGNKEIICKPRGKFRKLGTSLLVGDIVLVDTENKIVLDVEKRKNSLERPSIANVDQVLIVTSVHIPNFSSNLLDKLITIVEFNNITPIICFTKLDLLDKNELAEIEKIQKYYRSIGYEVYNNTDENLIKIFKNKITVLAGQSGAGKSSLINILDKSLNIKTGDVSVALGRGKHTTRHTELLNVCGGLIADTPGFSLIDFNSMTKEDIRDNFIEFNKYKDKCEYKDCMHESELKCEIKNKVSEGKILESRYQNYLKFIKR